MKYAGVCRGHILKVGPKLSDCAYWNRSSNDIRAAVYTGEEGSSRLAPLCASIAVGLPFPRRNELAVYFW